MNKSWQRNALVTIFDSPFNIVLIDALRHPMKSLTQLKDTYEEFGVAIL